MPVPICKSFDDLLPGELYRILKARAEVFVIEQACIYPDADDKDYDATHLLLWDSGQLAAYCRLLPPGISYPGYSSIGRVLTSMPYRRQGLGKQLMQEAIKQGVALYQAPIKISAQLYLEPFYQSFGFETVSAPYLEDAIPHIAMVLKQLPQREG
jgi:ElaA protein